jgi:WhiB family redox-sensing transcriptional regulator
VARLGSSATPHQVAALAGVSRQAAWKALHDRSTGLAELAAAADALTVTALARCARCGTVITFDPRKGPRRACSARCGMALGRELRREQQQTGESPSRWPPVTGLPPAPDFSKGLCTTVKPDQRRYWTSSDPGEREAAAHMCAGCPVREPCTQWSLALPVSDPAIYGGMSADERRRRRRAWLEAIAQQVRGLPWP